MQLSFQSRSGFDPSVEIAHLPTSESILQHRSLGSDAEQHEEYNRFVDHVRSLQEPNKEDCPERQWVVATLSPYPLAHQLDSLARVAACSWFNNVSIILPREAVHKVSDGQCGPGYSCNYKRLTSTCSVDDLLGQNSNVGRHPASAFEPDWYNQAQKSKLPLPEDLWVSPPCGATPQTKAYAMTYLLSGSPWSTDIENTLRLLPAPRLGVHIRHGDSCNDDYLIHNNFARVCTPTKDYAGIARFLVDKYSLKSIYVTSDDPSALLDFKASIQNHGLRDTPVIWLDHDRSKYDTTQIIDGRGDLDWPGSQNETAKDLWALASCDVLLGTAVSNMFVDALSMSNVLRGYDIPYISVETAVGNRFPDPGTRAIGMKSQDGSQQAFVGCKQVDAYRTWTTEPVTVCDGSVSNLVNAFPEIKAYM